MLTDRDLGTVPAVFGLSLLLGSLSALSSAAVLLVLPRCIGPELSPLCHISPVKRREELEETTFSVFV
jgi:hypothetical protein